MRFNDIEGLRRLIVNRIPESDSLEYKSMLILATETQRLELLKDLTGMGNGGGGAVIFGMDEEFESSIAKELTPMEFASIEGQVEDIVRDAIHPPLIWDHRLIPCGDGWILLAEVEPSIVGPYRIDAYKDGRYYKRYGKKTAPMSEQEVRDAYSLASRSSENRAEAWNSHFLPLKVESDVPWIVISALPREPFTDLFDSLPIDIGRYRTVGWPLQNYHVHTQLSDSLSQMKYWADGIAGDDGFRSDELEYLCAVRLHRDGAACLAHRLPEVIDVRDALRVLNALLIYLGSFWSSHSLRRPVEIRIDMENLDAAKLSTMPSGLTHVELIRPVDVNLGSISMSREVTPTTLGIANERHLIAKRLATHLSLAYGQKPTGELFEFGFLFGRDGQPTSAFLGTGDLQVEQSGSASIYGIDDSSQIVNPGGAQVYVSGGALLDRYGDCLAVLEMATGVGCPSDFIPRLLDTSGFRRRPDVVRRATSSGAAVPVPTGKWSNVSLVDYLR